MLHHASFNARDPETAAKVLAKMLAATVVRAPAPPFPTGSWFVCIGDDHGSLLEILPWGAMLDQDVPMGIGFDPDMRRRCGAHVLVSTPNSLDAVCGLAVRAGWHSELVGARLFKVLKVWVENGALVEFLTPEIEAMYRATFGRTGMAALDGKLRELEKQMAAALAARTTTSSQPEPERPLS